MLGVGWAFLNYFDDSWQSSKEAEQLSGMPTFSFIPGFEEPRLRREMTSWPASNTNAELVTSM
jgi:hypothetical protein